MRQHALPLCFFGAVRLLSPGSAIVAIRRWIGDSLPRCGAKIGGGVGGCVMGEAKIRHLSFKQMRELEPRCIYCASTDTSSIEHMPPRLLWDSEPRPRGHEFVSCQNCNRATSAADSVAGMMAYIRSDGGITESEFKKIQNIMKSVNERVPGLGERLLDNSEKVLVQSLSGLLRPAYRVQLDDDVANEVLGVFAAKVGMSLYRQHIGKALPLEGAVMTSWFGNIGISMSEANAMLEKLPLRGELKHGMNNARGKFDYRYGAHVSGDLLMALASFRNSLHVFVIAVSKAEMLKNLPMITNTTTVFRPGTLVDRLKKACASGA